MKKLLFIALIAVLMAGCSQEKKAEVDLYAYPGNSGIGPKADIQGYFDSLISIGAKVIVHSGDEESIAEVWEGVKQLDRYVKGERKYYPVEEVNHAIEVMAFEQGYYYGHSSEEDYEVDGSEMFLFRFIEQAVMHSPVIDYVTHFHSDGGETGMLCYKQWNTGPLYSFFVYKTDEGLRVLSVGERGETEFNKVFKLTDKKGRTYYLCSGNMTGIYNMFCQYLYGWDGKTMQLLGHVNSNEEWGDYGYDEVIFNPRRLCWEACVSDGNVYRKVAESPTLRLVLDWEKSRFELEVD